MKLKLLKVLGMTAIGVTIGGFVFDPLSIGSKKAIDGAIFVLFKRIEDSGRRSGHRGISLEEAVEIDALIDDIEFSLSYRRDQDWVKKSMHKVECLRKSLNNKTQKWVENCHQDIIESQRKTIKNQENSITDLKNRCRIADGNMV